MGAMLFWVTAANAATPLVPAAEVADQGLSAWWKAGDFIVGRPDAEDKPAVRPLIGPETTTLPASMEGWTPLGASCDDEAPKADANWGETKLNAAVSNADEANPAVELVVAGRLTVRQGLGKPARICALLIGESDPVPGPELIVAWRMDKVHGFTIFHIPEAVR